MYNIASNERARVPRENGPTRAHPRMSQFCVHYCKMPDLTTGRTEMRCSSVV